MNWERQLKRAFPDWEIVRGKKHIRLKHPSGAVHYASSTPSDHRTFMNLKAGLKRLARRVPCSTPHS